MTHKLIVLIGLIYFWIKFPKFWDKIVLEKN